MPDLRSRTGRRPVLSTSSWTSRYRRVFEYWENIDAGNEPEDLPEYEPTSVPTSTPSSVPTSTPTSVPTSTPISVPTSTPTSTPTSVPTSTPSSVSTSTPTSVPTSTPTSVPTSTPSIWPTGTTTTVPTSTPTTVPTSTPTVKPADPNIGKPDTNSSVIDKEIEQEVLKVRRVDLNLSRNTLDHLTFEYDVIEEKGCLVVRRGQMFDIDLEFNRYFDKEKDDLRIVFQFGKKPISTRKTEVGLLLSADDKSKEWGAVVKSNNGNSVKIGMTSPPDCYVGKWFLKVEDVRANGDEISVYRYSHPSPIYVLFNPWCKDDAVYMRDKQLLCEYVLNENGRLYIGSSHSISSRGWSFGQFDGIVLDCALYLLDEMSGLPDQVRGNPIAIVRKISALINSPDDFGILVGNWSGEYEDGTSPSDWTGSVAILEQFYKEKMPVRFGQCWVFSALFTTIGRALGIPIRSVTNFDSAHDTDGTIAIEKYFDDDGEQLTDYEGDSIWNFHVWNDVWMARPDLPSGYGGWQAVDATPQETSDGVFCMGPMSLKAIKNGELYMPYDGPFVFAEVNGDVVHWLFEKDESVKIGQTLTRYVGKRMSTKDPDGHMREDVTDQYKFLEGSREERAAVYRANLHSSMPEIYMQDKGPKDVDCELKMKDDTFVGDKVELELVFTNKSEEFRTLHGTLTVSSIYYTGVHHAVVFKEKTKEKLLDPGKEERIVVTIEESTYLPKLVDHCILNVSGLFLVDQTKESHFVHHELRLRKPHLSVTAVNVGKRGQKLPIEVTFTNPLSVTLTECELRAEGAGLQKPLVQKCGDVTAKAQFTGKFDITPRKLGKRELTIVFGSKQLRNINGTHEIAVE